MSDAGGWVELTGEAKVAGPMSGVREGPSEGVTGYPPQDPTRSGERGG